MPMAWKTWALAGLVMEARAQAKEPHACASSCRFAQVAACVDGSASLASRSCSNTDRDASGCPGAGRMVRMMGRSSGVCVSASAETKRSERPSCLLIVAIFLRWIVVRWGVSVGLPHGIGQVERASGHVQRELAMVEQPLPTQRLFVEMPQDRHGNPGQHDEGTQAKQAKGDQFLHLPEGDEEPGDDHRDAKQAQAQGDQQAFLFSIHHVVWSSYTILPLAMRVASSALTSPVLVGAREIGNAFLVTVTIGLKAF